MDTPTSAAPDEKTPPSEETLATQPGKEKSNPAGPLEITTERFNSSVARLTSNSIDELHKLAFELQKMQEFLKSEVESVQRQIDSAVAGINIIVETIGPWKSMAGSQTLHQALATCAREDRRPTLSNAFASGSNGRGRSAIFAGYGELLDSSRLPTMPFSVRALMEPPTKASAGS